ncbi:MAG: hypothetical protein AMXMBFR44_1510 [Candidatus Campbellbacteria bacterium]
MQLTTKGRVTKRAIKGIGAAVIAAALFLSGPQVSSAATVAELQAQLNALLAQLAALQGGSSVGCYTFTANLTVGSTGPDVTALQSFLESKGYFTYTGPKGYFGPITQASVAAWQAANSVSPAVGYFGPISRAKYSATCTPIVSGGGSTSGTTLSGGEADLRQFDASSGDDSDVEEGSDGDVFEFEFDVEDGDVEVQRVDIMFANLSGDGDEEPWKVFDEITLMLDGDEVDSIDGSDEDNWDEDADDEYRLRFSGLDAVVEEDETAEFVLNVEVQNNIDDADQGPTWTLWIEDDGIRALDGEGIDHEIGDDTDTVEFDIGVAGEGEELTIRESRDNPDATVLELEDDKKSNWLTVLAFTMEAEDNDIEIREIPLRVTVSSSTYAAIVDDAMLVIDGDEFDDFTASTTLDGGLTFDFDRGDVVVDEGDEVEVELMLRFKALVAGNEGMTVTAAITSADVDEIDAEGADDLGPAQLKGSATGDEHTLRTEGIVLTAGDTSADDIIIDGGSDRAKFIIEFEVTAFGEDYYVPFGAASSTEQSDEGVSFALLNDSNAVVAAPTGTTTASLSSTADEDDSAYVVREGDTESFTLTVTYTPGAAGNFKLLLDDVFFRLNGELDSAAVAQAALPEADYRTGVAQVQD